MHLEFFGAAGEVTGSCHILTVAERRILLDCGLIQGGRKAERRNRDAFPFDPGAIDAVVLSHAHLDHSGRLPLLCLRGFDGKIHAQNASRDLCRVLLLDAASLAETDARHETRRRLRKGLPGVEPLYTVSDAQLCLRQIRGHRYDEWFDVVPGVRARYRDAGHILGSTAVELELDEGDAQFRLVFSGDLGQYDTPILRDPAPIESADLVLMESTYGGRKHRDRAASVEELGEVISGTRDRGNILIPCFAVGRSQEILYQLGSHYDDWDLGRWEIFLDSPMAIQASEIYWGYPHLYDEEASALYRENARMPLLPNLHLSRTADESRAINRMERGAIVLAGSGMCTGGRILHHFKHNLWRESCHVVIVGYQAHGTLGRRLVDGAEYVKIMGETIRVAAQIHTIGGFSAHGDEADLLRWYGEIGGSPPVYLVHGETDRAQAMGEALRTRYGTDARLAEPGQRIDLIQLKAEQ